MFVRSTEAAISNPLRTIVIALALTTIAAPGLFRLELRTDGQALVPPEDPAILFDRDVRDHFGLRDPIIILLETSHPQGIYNPETLRRIAEISTELAKLPGIGLENVSSLATERRHRPYPGTWKFRPFLDPLPDTPELLRQVRSDLADMPLFRGILVSASESRITPKAAAILIGAPDDGAAGTLAGAPGRHTLYRQILDRLEPFENETDRFVVAGAPVAEALLGRHILEDLAFLLPSALAVVALVLWLGCRRFWGVALGLTEVLACLVWTFGLMGWLGVPIYLTTAVLPVILVAVGLADEIHIFWHYQRLSKDREMADHPATVRDTMAQMTRPVVLTSVTSTVGFLSFLSSSIAPLQTFALFAGLGIVFCLVWSLTVIPATLILLPASSLRRPSVGRSQDKSSIPNRLIGRMHQRRRWVLAVLATVTLVLGSGVRDLEVQDSWIDGFARDSPFRQATERINRELHGTHTLLVHLTFDPPPETVHDFGARRGPLLEPRYLEACGHLESFLRARPEVGGVIGPYEQLTTTAFLWGGRRENRRAIPEDPRQVNVLLGRFELSRGEKRQQEVFDKELRRAVIRVFLKSANYRQTQELMDAVRDYEAESLASMDITLDFAGDVAVSQAMIPAIVRGQISSLMLALLGALATICLLYRSLTAGLCAIAPAAVAVLWLFGIMGWSGIPLGVATSMFSAITLAIGVDHGIHFVERFRRHRAAGSDTPAAIATEEAGPAIIIDTLAIACGFGVLVASQVPANAHLGLLVATALAASCWLTLAGLGTWLAKSTRDQNR